jgi:protein-S-isoprenylcysteine O-methyltransferase Ste14
MQDLKKRAPTNTLGFLPFLLLLILSSTQSLNFWQAWTYWAIFSASVLIITLYFLKHDPKLIEGAPALGSIGALIFAIPTVGGVAWRLLDEKKFLSKNLTGYAKYCKKSRYRLIPFVW